MEQPLLIPVELEPFTFNDDLCDYAALGLHPSEASVSFIRQFARQYQPV